MSVSAMVLSYLRVLVWPALIFALAVAFRSTIRRLMQVRLTEIDAAGFSAKFEEVAHDAEKVVQEDHPRLPDRPKKLERADIVRISPHNYYQAREIGETFRSGKPVLLDLTKASDDFAKRMVDFSAGVMLMGYGWMDRLGDREFLLLPYGVSAD